MPQPEERIRPFWVDLDPAGKMLRVGEVVSRTGLSRSQIYALIAAGRFPPMVKLSERASAMPEEWLNAYFRLRAANTLADSGHVPSGADHAH